MKFETLKVKFMPTKNQREKRYKEKINYGRDRINDLEEWLNLEDIKERRNFFASEKAFQEVVEYLADIFSMLISDLNLGVSDDYSNIEKLKEKKILSKEDAKTCISANGLRNRVVHRYNHIDTKTFIESSKELIPELSKIFDVIEEYLKNVKSSQTPQSKTGGMRTSFGSSVCSLWSTFYSTHNHHSKNGGIKCFKNG